MSFPTIHGSSDPEEYSWEVSLGQGQSLKSIDSEYAEVVYEDGTVAIFIQAAPAHDADGTTVPTSLSVPEGNVITLTVHHRAGNPAAGGAPFVYPVSSGPGFEIGNSTVTVVLGPKDETELREERERIATEEREAAQRAGEREAPGTCRVPWLRGSSLRESKRWLLRADCKIGTVSKRRHITAKFGEVVKQSPRQGTVLAPGGTVDLVLGE
jgi:hypothetical protein